MKTRAIALIVFVAFAGGILLFLAGAIASEFSHPLPILLDNLFKGIGSGLVTSAIFFFLSQFPAVQMQIVDFFLSAFTNPRFVQAMHFDYWKDMVAAVLRSRFQDTYPPSLFESYLQMLEHAGEHYVQEHTVHVKVHVREGKLIKEKRVGITFIVTKGMDIWALIPRITRRRVSFENTTDSRRIVSLNVEINGGLFLHLDGEAAEDLVVATNKPENTQFPLKTTLNWDLARERSEKPTARIKEKDRIRIDVLEERVTGMNSTTLAYRLLHMTERLDITAEVTNGCTLVPAIKIFGSGILDNETGRHSSACYVNVRTERWLLPGSGFMITFRAPQEGV